MSRLKDEIANLDLRIKFLENKNAAESYTKDIIVWKSSCRNTLLPYMGIKKYRRMFRNLYPEINFQYLMNPDIRFNSKINFIMNYLGLHNFWSTIKSKLYK